MNRSLASCFWLALLWLPVLGCENHPMVIRPGDDTFNPQVGGAGGAPDTTTTSIQVGFSNTSTGGTGTGGSPEAGCGDGALDGDEACDDGNTSPGDGCDDVCQVEGPEWRCEVPGSNCFECGNGVLEGSEVCDDANGDGGDEIGRAHV